MITDNLNSREKVKRLINSGKAEKVLKGELVIEDKVVKEALGCEYVGFEERKELVESLELDLITVSPRVINEDKPFEDFDAKNYLFPDLHRWVSESQRFIFAILDGAFERGMQTLGMEEFFHLLKNSTSELQEWIQAVEKFNLDLVRRLEAEGIDGVILADDVAYAGGLMAHPQNLRDYFIPSLTRQVEKIKRSGLAVFYHSDGSYQVLFEDIIQAGFDGLHCIDRNSGMDISTLQEKARDRVCLWGHLDVQDLEEVVQEPKKLEEKAETIKKLASGQRFLLGTSSGLFEGMNIEGLRALYQVL